MSFLVTGCGRSGTMFLARLLNEVGVRTSHEEFFTAHTPPGSVRDFPEWLIDTYTLGEVSNLAAAWLAGVPRCVMTAMIIRNPVAVIRSIVGSGAFRPESHYMPNVKFAFRHCDGLNQNDPPVVLAMKYWLLWNRNAMAGRRSLKQPLLVEAISDDSGYPALAAIASLTTHPATLGTVREALKKLGSRYNGGARDPGICWNTLPNGEIKDQIMEDAMGYGYSAGDLEGA